MNTDNTPSTPTRSHAAGKDAIAMLRADHDEVNALFAAVKHADGLVKKKELVGRICAALSLHAQIEEEIFYPAVQAALKDHLLVPEAKVEHGGVKALIAQLVDLDPGGEMYDARLTVLSEYVKHHVREEQTEMFPKVKSSSLDLVALGEKMATRKAALLQAAPAPKASP